MGLDTVVFSHLDEYLMLAGRIDFRGDVKGIMRLKNFNLQNIHVFGESPSFTASTLALNGAVNSEFMIGGTVKVPVMNGWMHVTDIGYKGLEFGFANAIVRYEQRAADISIRVSKTNLVDTSYQLLLIGTVPVDLSFGAVSERFGMDGMNLYLKTEGIDLSLIDPFVDELDEVHGALYSSIHCTGSLLHPKFVGSARLDSGKFLLTINGLNYLAAGQMEFQDTIVSVSSFAVKNIPGDYTGGKLEVRGRIGLNGFLPAVYMLRARGEVLALKNEIRPTTQGVYGDVIAATGTDSIRFEGNFARSLLAGSINIRQASLNFPPTRQATATIASRYVRVTVIDDTSKLKPDTTAISTLLSKYRQTKTASATNEPSFLDGLGYDLTMQTDGIVQIKMVFNQTATTNEELFADLNGKLTMSKVNGQLRLVGSINVSERSNYTFYKKFDASGTLTFTGVPDNPQLDIKARYIGTHMNVTKDTSIAEKVTVSLAISGTRLEPKVKIGMAITDNQQVETERTGDVEGDAISFLLTSSPGTPGKFRDDLTSRDKQSIATTFGGPIGEALISGYANTLLSGLMLDFFRANNITFVSNAEVRYVGASPDLRLSGEVLNAYWSFGGRVFNDINNANISVQLPLGPLIGDETLRNFMVELERRNEGIEVTENRRSSVTGARVYYRIIF